MSIAAAPDPLISFYDTTTLSLRLFIIFGLFRPGIKTKFVLITTFVIMAIKVFLFPTQLIMQVKEKESLKRSEQTKQKLLGNWIGIYEYDSTYMSKTTHIVDSTFIEFNTTSIILFNFKNVDSIQLNIEFQYEYGGFGVIDFLFHFVKFSGGAFSLFNLDQNKSRVNMDFSVNKFFTYL